MIDTPLSPPASCLLLESHPFADRDLALDLKLDLAFELISFLPLIFRTFLSSYRHTFTNTRTRERPVTLSSHSLVALWCPENQFEDLIYRSEKRKLEEEDWSSFSLFYWISALICESESESGSWLQAKKTPGSLFRLRFCVGQVCNEIHTFPEPETFREDKRGDREEKGERETCGCVLHDVRKQIYTTLRHHLVWNRTTRRQSFLCPLFYCFSHFLSLSICSHPLLLSWLFQKGIHVIECTFGSWARFAESWGIFFYCSWKRLSANWELCWRNKEWNRGSEMRVGQRDRRQREEGIQSKWKRMRVHLMREEGRMGGNMWGLA